MWRVVRNQAEMLERSRMIRPADLIGHPFRCNITHQTAASYILVEEIICEDNENSLKHIKLSLNAFPAPTLSATVAVSDV